jgi:phenylacetate-CoA ligase
MSDKTTRESNITELSSLQLERFQKMLAQLLESNVFYKNKLEEAGIRSPADIQNLDDYRKLPFTEKRELSRDQESNPPYGTNLSYPVERYVRVHQTSGTTGNPLKVLDTNESWDWWADCWSAVYQAAGVTASDRIMFGFSFGPFIGFWSAYAGANKIGALAIPGGGMSSRQRAKAIMAHDATVLVCTPTYALHLAEVAREIGIDPASSSIRVTIQAGEPGASLLAVKHKIEEAWGARCFDHAGASEVGAWGFESQASDGMRLNEEQFIFEVLDPITHEPANEGELIISNLGRVGMPIIRYRTGDRVKLKMVSGADGSQFRVLDGGIIGRADDLLIVRGINVFPSAIENIVRQFQEVGEFAVDIYKKNNLDEIEIRLETRHAEPEALAASVAQELYDRLSLRVTAQPVPFGSLPLFDLKAKRFTDHRDLNGVIGEMG